jgi:transmembrane sensor
MNSSSLRPDSAIDERAAYWAARLDGEALESGERASLDAWLAQAPAHRAALSSYCQLSADLEEQLPRLVAAGAVTMPAPVTRRRWSVPRLAGVALAAAAAVMFAVWVVRPASSVENLTSAVAQRSTHTLSDGTRVELNANTSLRYEQGPAERRVRLAGGEACFAVAKDRARPFIVETPAGSVRVTGTPFHVRTEPAAQTFEVTVVEGSVQVRPGAGSGASRGEDPIALGAGEQLVAQAGGLTVKPLTPADLEDALAWRQGLAVFNGVPLRDAAARFARYHGRRIAVDPAIAGERVGGMYSLDDLSGFLAGMESTLGVDFKFDQNGAAFLRPRRVP